MWTTPAGTGLRTMHNMWTTVDGRFAARRTRCRTSYTQCFDLRPHTNVPITTSNLQIFILANTPSTARTNGCVLRLAKNRKSSQSTPFPLQFIHSSLQPVASTRCATSLLKFSLKKEDKQSMRSNAPIWRTLHGNNRSRSRYTR